MSGVEILIVLVAAVWAGLLNILFGLFAGTFLHLMGILPAEALAAPIADGPDWP